MRTNYHINPARFASLLAASALVVSGCGDFSPGTIDASEAGALEFSDYDLRAANGGMDKENERPAFGRPDFAHEFGEGRRPSPEEREPIIEADEARPTVDADKAVYLRIVWGQIHGLDNAQRMNWSGGLQAENMGIRLERVLRFEKSDQIVRRHTRDTLRWSSVTGTDVDGIIVSLRPRPTQVEPQRPGLDDRAVRPALVEPELSTLTFRTGPVSEVFALRDLFDLDLIIPADRGGNGVSFQALRKIAMPGRPDIRPERPQLDADERPERLERPERDRADIDAVEHDEGHCGNDDATPNRCAKGFISGRWQLQGRGEGVFGAAIESLDGALTAHVRGVFGVRNGEQVLFGKIIDADGGFNGFLKGKWESNDAGAGQFKGVWVTANGRHKGQLTGHLRALPDAIRGGLLHGRFKEDCRPVDGPVERPACMCNKQYAPVCGADGETYGNDCMARCAGVELVARGECEQEEELCVCTREYAPVCGVDGETYGNACTARCAGMRIEQRGECDDERQCLLLCAEGFELAPNGRCACVPVANAGPSFDAIGRRIVGGLAGADLDLRILANGAATYSQSYAFTRGEADVQRARLSSAEVDRLDYVVEGFGRLEASYNCNRITGHPIMDAPDVYIGVKSGDRGKRVEIVSAVCWDELPDVLAELNSTLAAIVRQHFSPAEPPQRDDAPAREVTPERDAEPADGAERPQRDEAPARDVERDEERSPARRG